MDLELAIIGNGTYAGLLDQRGRLVWACMPRFDGDPVFCSLLDDDGEKGIFEIHMDGLATCEQYYVRNTALVRTVLTDSHGAMMEIVDHAPRFKHYGRVFRPVSVVRRIRPLKGQPMISIRLRPAQDYNAGVPERTQGSNHIRYVSPDLVLRLTTDVPTTFVMSETPFILDRELHMILGPDEPLTRSCKEVARDFEERTTEYWLDWSRHLAIPFEWQPAVIRAAITLKLCTVEETGAVIAAATTSLPEAPGSGRCWDYRFCWLRDAFFTVHALNRLGTTKTMEQFLRYILNIVRQAEGGILQPVYGIGMEARLDEHHVPTLKGYRGEGPVRRGNLAYEQIQHDVYGSVILAVAQAFFDERLGIVGDIDLFHRLEELGAKAAQLFDQPDAGIWELRGQQRVHSFSSMMCWAACDRLGKIAAHMNLDERARHWISISERIKETILERTWNAERNCFVSTFDGDELDAAMLLMPQIGFIDAMDERFQGTLKAIEGELKRGDHLFRYAERDDFGYPENAFNICTFWYIEALALSGRREEARALFETMLECRTRLGLLSEDLDPKTGELWGNFPQTYPMVGLISAAMRLSKPWEEAF